MVYPRNGGAAFGRPEGLDGTWGNECTFICLKLKMVIICMCHFKK